MILLYITVGLLVFYSFLILNYRAGWKRVPLFTENESEKIKISVVIPARNEEKNIGTLLTSIKQQSYPKDLTEVIIVDDHSTDNTARIANEYSFVKLIRLQDENLNSYKKKAIEKGIESATGSLIVTTDADCIAPQDWLNKIASFKSKTNAAFITAPVVIENNKSLLQFFQSLDFLVLQGITAASVNEGIHNMSNGANLAYDRNVFYEVNGFSGIDQIASGDDMLLMQKIAEHYPGKIAYLLSEKAIVKTSAVKTWKEFFNQRRRWASKATYYKDKKIKIVLLLVYLFNLCLLILFITGFWNFQLWRGLVFVLLSKTIVEYFFIMPVASFFKKNYMLKWFPLFQPLHIIYTVVAGFFGVFGKVEWKGRYIK